MKDETIYFINQHSIFRHPKIWSKRDYWVIQIVSAALGIPLIILLIEVDGLPLFSSLLIVVASSIGGAVGGFQGRRRAERYVKELATGINSPFYGKYTLEETRYFMGI